MGSPYHVTIKSRLTTSPKRSILTEMNSWASSIEKWFTKLRKTLSKCLTHSKPRSPWFREKDICTHLSNLNLLWALWSNNSIKYRTTDTKKRLDVSKYQTRLQAIAGRHYFKWIILNRISNWIRCSQIGLATRGLHWIWIQVPRNRRLLNNTLGVRSPQRM